LKQEERDNLLIRLDERITEINKDIKIMRETLFGNGHEGMCYTVNRNSTYLKLLGVSLVTIPPVVAIIVNIIL